MTDVGRLIARVRWVQCFFLTRRHRRALADLGAASYHIEQHEDETVYIPAGCPHQVTASRMQMLVDPVMFLVCTQNNVARNELQCGANLLLLMTELYVMSTRDCDVNHASGHTSVF